MNIGKGRKYEVAKGKVYGKLTVLYPVRRDSRKYQVAALCRCECGNEKVVDIYNLENGHTISCGCNARNYGLSKSSRAKALQGKKDKLAKLRAIRDHTLSHSTPLHAT